MELNVAIFICYFIKKIILSIYIKKSMQYQSFFVSNETFTHKTVKFVLSNFSMTGEPMIDGVSDVTLACYIWTPEKIKSKGSKASPDKKSEASPDKASEKGFALGVVIRNIRLDEAISKVIGKNISAAWFNQATFGNFFYCCLGFFNNYYKLNIIYKMLKGGLLFYCRCYYCYYYYYY